MATVRVFVDDAVQGRLPQICLKTGQPADLVVQRSLPVGGLGAAWLLLLLGPLGFIALVVLAFTNSAGESLTVRLPYLRAAWERERQLRHLRLAAFVMGVVLVLMALARPYPSPQLWLALGAAFLVAAFALCAGIYFDQPSVSLDASRRWVTFGSVHPAFAHAVAWQEAKAPPRP